MLSAGACRMHVAGYDRIRAPNWSICCAIIMHVPPSAPEGYLRLLSPVARARAGVSPLPPWSSELSPCTAPSDEGQLRRHLLLPTPCQRTTQTPSTICEMCFCARHYYILHYGVGVCFGVSIRLEWDGSVDTFFF
jgi:hypothetical protein